MVEFVVMNIEIMMEKYLHQGGRHILQDMTLLLCLILSLKPRLP